jgi:hypothetical protein
MRLQALRCFNERRLEYDLELCRASLDQSCHAEQRASDTRGV